MSKRGDRWRRLVSSFESSGLSRAEFCRRRGLNYQTMSSWIRRFALEDAESADAKADDARASFVEVSIPVPADPTPYEVVLGDRRRIRLTADFDAAVLGRLIRTVESC